MFKHDNADGPSTHGPSSTELYPACSSTLHDNTFEHQLERLLERVPSILRLPAPKARCPYTGLSRTAMVELVAPTKRNGGQPPVKAIYRKANRYAQRGTWLIPSENLFRVLLTQAESSIKDFDEAKKLRPQHIAAKEEAK